MAVISLRRPDAYADTRVLHVREWARAETGTGVPRLVPMLATLVALLATLWSWHSGMLTLYGDARAHLDVARHVTDGPTPGLAQLGSVWLPLQHILLVPLVAIDPLWHSALAGSIVGGACFVYSAVRMFSLGEEWLGSRRCAWVAFLLYASNVNLLYVQTTALTEPVLLAFFIGAAYRLARWMRTMKHQELLMAAVLTACATLTRYDGWFVLVVGFVVVGAWSRVQERRRGATEANLIIFAAVGGFGILLWVLYNLVIFHDPLFFIHSSFSAQAQQASLQQHNALATSGSLAVAGSTYGFSILDVAGTASVGLGIFGLLNMMLTRGARRSRDIALICLLAAPIAFNVIALWTGQSTMRVLEVAPFGLWNVRYGLMALPLLALGGAALVRSNAIGHRTVLVVAAAGLLFNTAVQTPVTVADGQTGTSSAAAGRPELVSNYLHQHYQGGRILADEASSAPLIFASGLDLDAFVTVGSHPYYENAVAAPAANVEWIVAYDGDAMSANISAHPQLFAGYAVVIHDGRARLLERVAASTSPDLSSTTRGRLGQPN